MLTLSTAMPAAGFLLAPLILGLINWTKARVAGRSGRPVLQVYADLWKLLHKGAVYSTTTTALFRLGPVLGLGAVGTATLMLPLAGMRAPMGFAGDVVLFAGLLALARFATVVAALDTGSSFEGMGASREAMIGAVAEPVLYLALASLAIGAHSLSLSDALIRRPGALSWQAIEPGAALAAGALFLVLLAENARVPVDDPDTHLELTMVHEVMVLDHGGPDLAFITYASALKLWLFMALAVDVAVAVLGGPAWVTALLFTVGMAVTAVGIGLVESTMARVKMALVPQFLVLAGALAGFALVVAIN